MYRLVIADDEALVRTRLCYRNDWNAMGFEVAAALENGAEVLDFLEKEKADVLLLDICMYKLSGLDVAATVRKKYPEMIVVLLSGYQKFEYAKRAMNCHVYEYLLKPIDQEELKALFCKIKTELDEAAREKALLHSFGREEYDRVLAVSQMISGNMLEEDDGAWLAYARLKSVFHQLPEELRGYLIKNMLEELQSRLMHVDEKIADEFAEKLKTVNLSVDREAEEFTLVDLFSELKDELIANNKMKAKRRISDDSIFKACTYIDNHLGDSITHRDVAEFLNMSPRNFQRRFFNEMKENFSDYLLRKRLEGAVKLLEDGTVDAVDVPLAVGYKDEKHFQKLFKEYTGYSIREFQKRGEHP